MSRNKFSLNSDRLFGLTAMLVSLVTLIIFVRQTNIMDVQSRMSVLPYLIVEQSTSSSYNTMQFNLANHGVGPAIIESRRIVYNGKGYDQDLFEFMTQSIPKLSDIEPYNWSNIYKGQAIPSNGKVTMIAVGQNPEDYTKFATAIDKLLNSNGFYLEIVYRSIYGDRWKITNKNEAPEKL